MSQYVQGLVSVIIPTYKRSELLMKSIDSVLNQSYRNLELIVVNDNEIGDEYSKVLYERIKCITDARFRFVEQEKHINGAAARNVGIRAAKGEYIAFQDDDDYWDLNKLERQVALLSSLDDSWGAVSCLKKLYHNGQLSVASVPYRSGNIAQEIVEGSICLGTGAVLIRWKALDKSGYFDESLSRHQDLQLFAQLAYRYKIMLDPVYMQNRETMDTQNRPTAEKMLTVKQAYFRSVDNILQSYPARKRNRVYAVHSWEVITLYMKEKDMKNAVKLFKTVLRSPSALCVEVVIISKKLVGRFGKNYLVHKYRNIEIE